MTLQAARPFRTPAQSLGGLDVEAAAAIVAVVSDVAIVLDQNGVIVDIAVGNDELAGEGWQSWVGRRLVETVTDESRPKIEAILNGAGEVPNRRWRQVNHPSSRGADIPVMYQAFPLGEGQRRILVGRDLRAIANLQQRLVQAQQSLDRDYARLRHLETRYRLLFQIASEAVLIVDDATGNVVEENPAATRLLGQSEAPVLGRRFPEGFDSAGTQAIQAAMGRVRTTGRAEEISIRAADGERRFSVSISYFRHEAQAYFLIRLSLADQAPVAMLPGAKVQALDAIDDMPDGFVLTDLSGAVLAANTAFLDLVQGATEEQVRGETLDRWLGRGSVDLSVILANLRERTSLRLFATTFRGEFGGIVDVEISAVAVPHGEMPCLAFIIRNINHRLPLDASEHRLLPGSAEHMTDLVGRHSLKDIVRDATDVIERLCIEAALELTGDNRASAAEMLGLSRQSLYVKLRRYGLGHIGPDGEGENGAGNGNGRA